MASELSNLIENELKNKGFYQPEDNHNKKASKTPAPPPSPPPQILGVSKCGTTDLYHRLSKHKDVIECAWKGPHFFVSAATCLVDEQLRPAFSRVLWCSSHATRHLKQLIQ
jgi:hypothetical protein